MEDELTMADIPKGEIHLDYAGRYIRKNDEGVKFVGYSVTISALKEKKPITIEGWMVEGEFLSFVRNFRDQINLQVICW